MPITLLDILLLAVMLISGLLAMIRGFMREILSIAAWTISAIAAIYFASRLAPIVKSNINIGDTAANAIAATVVFLVVLLLVSIITVRISDMILDSRVGALDRTLGFLFGLGRGLLIVVVAYLFFDWLVPDKGQPEWVRNGKSVVVLKSTGDWLKAMLPDDPESTILKRLKRQKPEDQEPPDSDQRSDAPPPPARTAAPPAAPAAPPAAASKPMQDIIQSTPTGNQ
jgi:membrane protein required for colicin V production